MNANNPLHIYPSIDEAQMQTIGQRISRALQPGDVVGLSGDLGTGKTTLARSIVRALSPDAVDVTSPTFTLMQDYPITLANGSGAMLLHCDLYRLEAENEVHSIGLLEMLHDHITLIEWPGIISSLLPQTTLHIECTMTPDKNTRQLAFYGVGDWKQRLSIK